MQKRILELNPKNGIVDLMKEEMEECQKIKSKDNQNINCSEKLQDLIKYTYWQAILLE
ncbi:MAG: hypothetical protein LBD88_03180 [Candidatus Peribacteria bacterium]|nr:hypothetical protein [Candidatus Peribacteria bacterium]